jgi:hypothetical protein
MAKANGTASPAPKKGASKPILDASVCIGALRVDYPGRFGEDEIPCDKTRLPLNVTCRALDGIQAIAQILYAYGVERDAGGEKAQCLSARTVFGLHEALIILVEKGNTNATDLGDALFHEAKGGV